MGADRVFEELPAELAQLALRLCWSRLFVVEVALSIRGIHAQEAASQ
jgi:hypothetical protein